MDIHRLAALAEESGMTQYVAANNKYLERFAELVAQECTNVLTVLARMPDDLGGNRYLEIGIERINAHLGIEK